MMSRVFSSSLRAVSAVVVVCGLIAGCAGTAPVGGILSSDDQAKDSSSLYGNYLAGRFAGSVRDTKNAAMFYQRALERDPENTVILERAFLLEVADGSIEEAVPLAEEVVTRDLSNRLGRLVLAVHAFKEGRYQEARDHVSNARHGPFSAILRDFLTAWSHMGEDDLSLSLQTLDTGESKSNVPTFFTMNRAFINDYAGDATAADQAYQTALEQTNKRSLRLIQGYGRFLSRQDRETDAARLYSEYLSLTPDNKIVQQEASLLESGRDIDPLVGSVGEGLANAIYAPASYLAQERQPDLPIIYLQLALYLDPDFDIARILLADLFESTRRWEEAIGAFAAVPNESALYKTSQIQIARNLDRLDRTDEAVSILRRMIRQNEAGLEAYVALGDMLRFRDRFEEAVEAYSDAITLIDPPTEEHWSLFYSRGVSLERSQRWTEAEQDFLRSISLSPNQPLTLNYLGYSWIDQGIREEEALRLIRKAVQLSPNDGYIVDSLGWAYYKRGEFSEAVKYLERAVELQPNDPVINEHLGDAYWQVGRRLEARFQWRHALSLEPEDKLIPVLERKLDQGLPTTPVQEASLTAPN